MTTIAGGFPIFWHDYSSEENVDITALYTYVKYVTYV